jgi:hypothetical protein
LPSSAGFLFSLSNQFNQRTLRFISLLDYLTTQNAQPCPTNKKLFSDKQKAAEFVNQTSATETDMYFVT